jgi:hypothetical protein
VRFFVIGEGERRKEGAVYWDLRHKTFCTNSDMLQKFLKARSRCDQIITVYERAGGERSDKAASSGLA